VENVDKKVGSFFTIGPRNIPEWVAEYKQTDC